MKKLLVVVDMQNDFVRGALGTREAQAALPAVKELIARERAAGTAVAFTQDTHGKEYPETQEGRRLPVPHCIKGEEGWQIVPELVPYTKGACVFEKGVFGSVALAEYARAGGFEEVVLCGVCTDICVVSNALLIKAYCPETTVCVVASACAGTTQENHNAALATMRSCQIEIL